MSVQKVELLREATDAFNRRDGAAFDALLARGAEIVPVRAALEETVYRGADAGSQYCAAVDKTWDSLSWEIEEVRDVGDAALALGRIRGKGQDSGAVIDTSAAWFAHFPGGLIARFRTYTDRGEALEAAGVSE
jgi:ketosteroid isomerase-like protein